MLPNDFVIAMHIVGDWTNGKNATHHISLLQFRSGIGVPSEWFPQFRLASTFVKRTRVNAGRHVLEREVGIRQENMPANLDIARPPAKLDYQESSSRSCHINRMPTMPSKHLNEICTIIWLINICCMCRSSRTIKCIPARNTVLESITLNANYDACSGAA